MRMDTLWKAVDMEPGPAAGELQTQVHRTWSAWDSTVPEAHLNGLAMSSTQPLRNAVPFEAEIKQSLRRTDRRRRELRATMHSGSRS